jgi:hypothetical protein
MANDNSRLEYEKERFDPDKIIRSIEETTGSFQKKLDACITEEQKKGNITKDTVKALRNRLDRICSIFVPNFSKADLLAIKYQNLYRRGSRLVYILAALSVITIAAQSLFSDYIPHAAIAVEILSIAGIILIIRYGNYIGWHRRWIDYRLLAERSRFAAFMAMIGEKASGMPRYNLHNRDKAHWVASYFNDIWRQWEETDKPAISGEDSFRILKTFIRDMWLNDQMGYHERNVKKHLYKHKRLSMAGEVIFFLTFFVAVFHFIHAGGKGLSPYWTFLAISLPAAGSAFSALRTHFEHNKLSRRSEAMAGHIENLVERISGTDNMESLFQIARDAEMLMLSENSEWHDMIGFHRLEAPG